MVIIQHDIDFIKSIDVSVPLINIVLILLLATHGMTLVVPFKGVLGIQCAACFYCMGYLLSLLYQMREFQSNGALEGYTIAVDIHPFYGCLLVSLGRRLQILSLINIIIEIYKDTSRQLCEKNNVRIRYKLTWCGGLQLITKILNLYSRKGRRFTPCIIHWTLDCNKGRKPSTLIHYLRVVVSIEC